ncbi:hypothetical protein BBJ28_00002060 [Nothophytophthora sp. Chile5]|nr:hypothetical protein BBJ28_00002060 [Nothophytophthora sp. Chile5]
MGPCARSDREIEQLFFCFLGGAFVVSALAVVAQFLLVPLLAALCFFSQRDAIQEQLRGFFGDSDDSSSLSSGGSGGGSLSTPPHGSQLAKMVMGLQVDKTAGYYVFLLMLAFVVAGLVEEYLKFWLIQGACCCCGAKTPSMPAFTALKQRQQRQQYHGAIRGCLCHPSRLLFFHRQHANHSFVVFLAVIAGALGFSVLENTGYSFAASTFGDKVFTAAMRGVASTSLHCICAGITGVRLAERLLAHRAGGGEERGSGAARADLGRWRTKLAIIYPAVLVHGVFDVQLFLLAALVTEEMQTAHPTRYGVVLPSVITLSILATSFVYLRRTLHAMELKMNEAHYIHVAVDLESGHRVGALNDYDDEMDFFGDDDEEEEGNDAEDEAFLRGNRKFEPPTKMDDVSVPVADSDNSSQGVDANGIVTGRWKSSIFGCMDTLVPNAVLSCCCPGLVVAQISARMGMMPFNHVLGLFGGLYLVAIIASATHSGFFDFVMTVCSIIAMLCCMRMRWRIRTLFNIPGSQLEDAFFSCCCGCCSIAQIASHVESYEPGVFAFAPRATLEGYSFS